MQSNHKNKASIQNIVESIRYLTRNGCYNQALNLCNNLIANDWQYEGYFERSYIYFYQKEYDLALKDKYRLLDMLEKKAATYFSIAEINRFKGNLPEAIKSYDKSREEDRDGFYEIATYFRAICFYNLNDYKNALQECLKLNPSEKLGPHPSVGELIEALRSKSS